MTYELDKDGYLESCTDNSTETNVSSGTTYTYTINYAFKWEQLLETITNAKKPTYPIKDKLAFFSSKSIIITFYE